MPSIFRREMEWYKDRRKDSAKNIERISWRKRKEKRGRKRKRGRRRRQKTERCNKMFLECQSIFMLRQELFSFSFSLLLEFSFPLSSYYDHTASPFLFIFNSAEFFISYSLFLQTKNISLSFSLSPTIILFFFHFLRHLEWNIERTYIVEYPRWLTLIFSWYRHTSLYLSYWAIEKRFLGRYSYVVLGTPTHDIIIFIPILNM